MLLGNVNGRVEGSIRANGVETSTFAGMKTFCKLVPQEDVLLASLTPRETLRFGAALKLPQVGAGLYLVDLFLVSMGLFIDHLCERARRSSA